MGHYTPLDGDLEFTAFSLGPLLTPPVSSGAWSLLRIGTFLSGQKIQPKTWRLRAPLPGSEDQWQVVPLGVGMWGIHGRINVFEHLDFIFTLSSTEAASVLHMLLENPPCPCMSGEPVG